MVIPTRNFKTATLQRLEKSKSTLTGAEVEAWSDVIDFQISITKIKSTLMVDKVRKIVETYRGLTKCNLLKADTTRIIIKSTNECYRVTDVTPSLWNNIDLERVETF